MNVLREKALFGVTWTTLATVSKQAFTILITIVLARYLKPEDFGLVAMVIVITSFASILSDFGLSAALIQKVDIDEHHISTIFWFNLFFGIFFSILFYLNAHSISLFYEKEEIIEISHVLAPIFILASLGALPLTILKKKLKFKETSIVEIFSVFSSGVLAVIMVIRGEGYWALVYRYLLNQLLQTLGFYFFYRNFSFKYFSISKLNELLKFGLYYMGSRVYSYWATKSDEVFIGKFAGTGQLGYYSNAYKIVLLPVSLIKNQIIQVFFPTISSIQHDHERIRNIALKLTSVLAIIGFSTVFYTITMAKPIVLFLLGDNWTEMIPIVQLLSLSIFFEITIFPGVIFLSQGRSDLYFKIFLITKSLRLVFMFIGVYYYGLFGLIYGLILSSILNFYPYIYTSGKLIDLKPMEIISHNSKPLLISLIAAVFTFLLQLYLPIEILFVHLFSYSITFWGLIYLICTKLKPKGYIELRTLVVSFLPKHLK